MTADITFHCPRCGLEATVPQSLSRVSVRDDDWEKCADGAYGVISCGSLGAAYRTVADEVMA